MADYRCTRCGQRPAPEETKARDLLTVKKVSFLEMGMGGRTLRSRVVDWLCPACVAKDEDYNREPFVAPGNTPPEHLPQQTAHG